MAERIKGLQIDLSMRDMGVSKTLAAIKREFRALNSSLKLSSNNFKYGEKSASSYKERMNDLDRAIKVGTSNLDELEKQYKEVAQSQGANSAKAVRLQTEYNKQANAINAMKDEYGRLNKYYKENFSMAGRLSNSFKKIGSSMQGVGQKAQDVGSSLSSKITKPALAAGTAMAGITAKLGFDRLVGLDSAKAKLEGLGYSTKEVGSITDQVAKAIEGGMTTMAEGTDIAAGALAAGVKEGKDLQHYIKLVGDAAVGANRPVGDMAMIFNRVQGQGKLMTEELNMIEEGMPGFAMAMSKHLGVSQEEFRKMVTEGKVTSEDFMTVMDDFAGGMAKSYAKSWKGMVQNTKAYIGILGENLLSGVFEQSKDGLREFEKLLQSPSAQKWAKDTGEQLGNAFSKIAGGIQSIIKWWQSLDGSTQKTLGGIVKWLGITLVTMGPVLTIFGKMASTIGGMFSGISGLIKFFIKHNAAAKISAASQAVWNGVTATARGIANGYRYAMAALSTSQTIQSIKSKIAAAAMTVWTGVTKAAALATKGLGLAIKFMTGPIGIVITVITALVGVIIYLWKTNSTFRNAVITAWNAIKNAAISVFGFIKPYIINIWNAIKNSAIAIWNGIKTSAVTIWNAIKFAVQHPIQALKNVLSALWNGMKAAAIKIWALLKNGVIAIIKAYVAQVRANFNLVKRIVLAVFNAIKSFSIKVWNAIKNGILNIVRGLRNGIVNIFKGIKNTVTTIFNAVKNFSIKVWNAIKNGVIKRAKGLWNGVKAAFNALKKGATAIFNAVKNFALKVWTNIKNSVVKRAKALWSGVKNAWNNLKKGTTKTFKAVGSFMSSKWSSIKSNTVKKAKGTWSGVKGAWGSLSKGTHKTMNSVGSFMSKKWKGIKSGTISLVTAMKNKVTGVMDKMGNVIKSVTGKIKGFFKGMISGVEKGLNGLIKGVNWVGKKLGMKDLPKVELHTGTESTHTQNIVTNGKVNRDTFATVGDKGRGNGPGGFRHEAIKYPNGKMALTPNRDTTAFLPKGSSVMNGAQTHSMLSNSPAFANGTLPKFASGTLSNKKPKKKKKGDNIFGDVWEGTKAGTKAATGKVVEGGKAVVNKSLEMAAKGKKWMEDKIGDVMDWIEKPGKLLDKVLEGVGLNLDGFGIKKAAELPYSMMKGMFGKLKKAAIDTFTSWMADAAEGDGGYIDLSKGINFPFSPNGRAPGYPFAGPHMGVDINYVYDKLYSVLAGKATARKGWNGGFGNMVDIVKGNTKVIYGHMSKHAFSGSKNVKPGDYLGVSGNSGRSSGPHLHFEVQKNGKPIDPLKWLKANDGGGGKSGKWNGDIKKALKIAGLPTSKAYVNAWAKQIQTESGGNPKALGGTDGLADGRAKGLVQVKPGTFNAYKAKGHGNIWNGLDNLIAGMRYAKARYGKGGMLSVVGKGHGYATGGLINSSGLYNLAEDGHPEFLIPTDPSRQSDAMKLLAIASQRIEGNKKNKRPNQMRTPSTSNNNDNEMMNVMARQLEATQRQVELLTQLVASNQRLEQKPTGVSEQDISKAQGKRAEMMAYNLGGAF
ncbi:peptidoglycan DD-metalloendopeptidase family protein [Staphylococcus pettenkoferi]|uniref:peptidoglycan DD-metalloendopeptidase family protein n=1 Tax=Staphylococcus pettenkoferi TaxID=170573 RepID=UPI000CD11685|nr:peptidoglycan DD-metalloendopeptidase family protein [Staphylococcus pettenkoferi]PNZ87007.1 phage tail tape measure protein [Staphylococcus pettenkoferi]QQC36849.1 peptidoglycan DD-metalloendopeptidase family protein [Staphylococcus pettenkoferi]